MGHRIRMDLHRSRILACDPVTQLSQLLLFAHSLLLQAKRSQWKHSQLVGSIVGDWNLADWKMTDCTNTVSHQATWNWNISC